MNNTLIAADVACSRPKSASGQVGRVVQKFGHHLVHPHPILKCLTGPMATSFSTKFPAGYTSIPRRAASHGSSTWVPITHIVNEPAGGRSHFTCLFTF